MQDKRIFYGVPQALARDGWWLDAPASSDGTTGGGDGGAGKIARAPGPLAILGLVALADILFWERGFGVSLALFALAIFAASLWQSPARSRLFKPQLLLVLGVLPVVDTVQALSLAFLAVALILALIWAHHPVAKLPVLFWAGLAFAMRLPLRWATPALMLGTGLGQGRLWASFQTARILPDPKQILRNWAFPIGGTLVFLALLMDANPVASQLFRLDLDVWAMVERVLFWLGIALLVAPLLSKDIPLEGIAATKASRLRLPNLGINSGSVLRALGMFNLLIGFQMLSDISILIGGADLPLGMSYADYAHRGAYPLLMTAILAGAFALAARPFLGEHRLIRPLMVLWLVQNVILCGAAALRLELYIAAYGLTYLRVHALIWMGLVATGLALTLWQTVRAHGNGWLLLRAASLAVATLYLCSFVNFAHIIAAQNLTREQPDMHYICHLGPMAAGAIVDAALARPDHFAALRGMRHCPALRGSQIAHWQEWGFRDWSVTRYIANAKQRSALHENPDRR